MALANLGLALSKQRQKVVLLDLDVDAPSMHLKFHNERLIDIQSGKLKGGYIDYLKQYYEPLEHKDKHELGLLSQVIKAEAEEKSRSLQEYVITVRDNKFLKVIPAGDS